MAFVEKAEKFLEKLPIWLRWILALPVAILVSTLIQFIVAIGNSFTVGPQWTIPIFCQIVNSYLCGYCFVWSGAIMAPKYKFITGIVFAIIFALVNGIVTTYVITIGAYEGNLLWDSILIILSIVASIVACIQIHQHLIRLDIPEFESSS